jgi:hypothetical protein
MKPYCLRWYNRGAIHGEVPEWTNGAVSKTAVVLVATVGSNPTLSAERKISDEIYRISPEPYRLPIC